MATVTKVHKCPICGNLTDNVQYRPFCSKRCADIDLGKWLTGAYSVPATEVDEEDLKELEDAMYEEIKFDDD